MKTKEEQLAWDRVLELWPDAIHNTKFKALLSAILKWAETIRQAQ